MVWMDEHRVMPKTVATAFPHVRWYREFCIALLSPMRLDERRRRDLWARLEPDFIAAAPGFVASFLGGRESILKATEGLPVNR